jgi:hypothetical protein
LYRTRQKTRSQKPNLSLISGVYSASQQFLDQKTWIKKCFWAEILRFASHLVTSCSHTIEQSEFHGEIIGEDSGPIGERDIGGEDDRWSSRARRVIVLNRRGFD